MMQTMPTKDTVRAPGASEVRSSASEVEAALPASARLQVATANVDACSPSRRAGIEQDLVAMADRRIRMRRDALERSLTYTADATMRRLMDK